MKAIRKNSKVVAFVMTLLLLTVPMTSFAAETGTITGDSTVDNVVVNVILPTSINFALDPLGLDATGDNQISTQDFFFVNQTLAPVKVSISLTAATSGSAVLISTPGSLSKDDTSATTKNLFFGALGATGLTGASITTTNTAITYSAVFGSTTGPAAKYASATYGAATLVPFTPNSTGSTGAAVIAFALDKAVESTTTAGSVQSLAASNKGVAAFEFYSEMNSYADWQANDITVSGAYTITPLRAATYDGFVASDMVSGGLNQMVYTPPVVTPVTPTYSSAGFIVNGATYTTHAAVTYTSGSAANIVLPFYFNSMTVASITSSTTSIYTVPTTQYAISAVDNTLTIYSDNAADWLRVMSAGTKHMTVTLSNNSTYTFDIIK